MTDQPEKFVIRFNKQVTRDEVAAAAEHGFKSTNAFILQAIKEKIERGANIDRLLNAAENYLRISEDGK